MSAVATVLQRARDVGFARYESLPAPLQDMLCSAYGAQEIVRRRGSLPSARARIGEIDALQFDRTRADALVEDRLRRVLTLARGLPGYTATPAETNGGSALDELAAWPVLRKSQLRDDPDAFLARRPEGSDIPSLTSGTSGTPLRIWRTRDAFRELFRSSAAARGWFGIPLQGRRASFTGKLVVPLSSRRVWRLNAPGRQLVLSQYHVGPRHIREYASILQRWRPEVLDGYTSNLVELAALFKAEGITTRIPLVVTTCETLTDGARTLLQEVFRGSVQDKYGTSENVVLANECPTGRRHVFQNVGLIEVVDDGGQRVPAGQRGRLVLTTLTNELMPLVRYDVGDVGAMSEEDCPCGRSTPILSEISGREDDVVITADGRRIGILAFNLLRGLEGVLAMQLVQRSPSSFVVRAHLVDGDQSPRDGFEASILSAFDRLVGPDPSRAVSFEYGRTIERTPGGKIRNVIRQFDDSTAERAP